MWLQLNGHAGQDQIDTKGGATNVISHDTTNGQHDKKLAKMKINEKHFIQ